GPASGCSYGNLCWGILTACHVLELRSWEAESEQPRCSALLFGRGLAVVVLSVAKLLFGVGFHFKQVPGKIEGFLGSLEVRYGLGIVRLGRAEVGAVQQQEPMTGLNPIPRASKDFNNPARQGCVDADEPFLVELNFSVGLQ